jgi:leader peptidase (prepilin peptidase)/N-methyltransferase
MWAEVAGASVLAWLAALSAFDIQQRRLPNWLTIPGALMILGVATAAGRGAPSFCGGAALLAAYLAVHLIAPGSMGAGDVKLAAGVGALTAALGLDVWVLAAIGAPLLTAVWACVVLIRRSGSSVPHGPSMCLATLSACVLVIFP